MKYTIELFDHGIPIREWHGVILPRIADGTVQFITPAHRDWYTTISGTFIVTPEPEGETNVSS